jgi:hypothetical protein
VRPAGLLQSPFQVLSVADRTRFNLLRRAAFLIDRGNALFEIHAGLDGPQDFVASTEHTIEEAELLVEQLIDALIRRVCLVQEIDDDHVEFLPVPVTAPDPLFDALGVPWKIVVHDEVAELEISRIIPPSSPLT